MAAKTSHTVRATDDEVIVAVLGEIDLSTCDDLLHWLQEAMTLHPGRALVVDLSGVRFIDSTGIRVLLDARRDAAAERVSYRVCGAGGVVLQVLQATGTYRVLTDGK